MSDYISREAAEKVFSQPVTMSMCLTLEECKQKNAQRQIDLFVIRGLPAADVVEVVRCKDCMYAPSGIDGGEDQGFALEWPHDEWPEDNPCPCKCEDGWYSHKPKPDFFCANGKREES